MFFTQFLFTDLFSALDGCLEVWSWLPAIIIVYVFFNKTYLLNRNIVNIFSNLGFGNKQILPFGLFVTMLIFFLVNVNLLGLTPFVYSISSSLWFASSLALIIWGLLIFSEGTYSWKKTLAHFVPSGSPAILIPFLILIEIVSVFIRPLTLTVRLIANIRAGHIVLALIANCLTSLNFPTLFIVFTVSVFYNMFEVFVCFIQAYIFTLLLKLYRVEHPFKWSIE